MAETCVHCKSEIGSKYNNEYYKLNSKIYCSPICYYDSIKEWKEEALKSYGKDLKKSRKKKGKKK